MKSRAIFTPEDDSEKKPRGRGRKPGTRYRLKDLLGDEEPQQKGASGDGDGGGGASGSGAGAGDALR